MSVIQVAGVSKSFRLQPDHPQSLQDLVVNLFARRRPHPREEVFWALRDVSFEVEAGETVGIVGPNGSGKSTCLKLLTRIIEPTSGVVQVEGRVSALLELGAGFHPELTGRENAYLYGSVLGLRRREMARRFDEIVDFAELGRFIDIPTKFYSSGMYVRLAFATAINVSPDILLVDEVLAVGDQSFQARCLDRIHQLKAGGVTIIFVSHSLDMVRDLCERTIWLDEGVLRRDGITDVVVGRYLEEVHRKEEQTARSRREAQRQASAAGESARSGDASSAGEEERDPMARYRSRWGSREAEITDVSLLDGDGHERLLLTTGEPMVVVMGYRARQRVERPMFGLAIHRSDGLQISGPNNILAGFDIPCIEGEGEVRYTVDVLPLLEGTYYLSASLYDASGVHAYDHHALMYEFRVRQGGIAERYGAVYLPARWEHVPVSLASREDAARRSPICASLPAIGSSSRIWWCAT